MRECPRHSPGRSSKAASTESLPPGLCLLSVVLCRKDTQFSHTAICKLSFELMFLFDINKLQLLRNHLLSSSKHVLSSTADSKWRSPATTAREQSHLQCGLTAALQAPGTSARLRHDPPHRAGPQLLSCDPLHPVITTLLPGPSAGLPANH